MPGKYSITIAYNTSSSLCASIWYTQGAHYSKLISIHKIGQAVKVQSIIQIAISKQGKQTKQNHDEITCMSSFFSSWGTPTMAIAIHM